MPELDPFLAQPVEHEPPTLLGDLDDMLGVLIATATGSRTQDWEYKEIRQRLLASRVAKQLPEFVRRFRTLGQFWDFIKRKHATYQERRDFLHE